MTAAIAPTSPTIFKKILELYGFRLELETELNWALIKEDAPRPVIVVPREGKFVSLDLIMEFLDQLEIDNKRYFELLEEAQR